MPEVCGGIVAGTCALWLANARFASRTSYEASQSTPAAYCEKYCTISTYEHASITESELAKLQSSPKFLQWMRDNEGRLRQRDEAVQRVALWKAACVLLLVVVATLGLPFSTFDLGNKNPKTLNDILGGITPLPRKVAALAGLFTIVCSLFAPHQRTIGSFAAVAGLSVCLVAGQLIAFGAGYVVLLAAVSIRVFLL
jgi:hypothetical protein